MLLLVLLLVILQYLISYKYRLKSSGHFDTLSCSFLLNNIMNWRFKILSYLFKLFIILIVSIIRRWSKSIPWYYFLPFWLIESLLFFLNQSIRVMLLYRFVDSNTTLCWGLNSRLLCLNSTCEFAFSIWHSSLLEFCSRLLVHLYVLPICISRGIISATSCILWLVGLFSVHGCFYYVWKTFLGVSNRWSTNLHSNCC